MRNGFIKEFVTSYDTPLRYAYFIFASLLFSFPLLTLLFYQADFMVIANENLAYRFFYSIRLHKGPDTGAWLPQGQLITSMQHIITWFLIKTGGLADIDSLRKSLNLFGFITIGFNCFVMSGIFFTSIKIPYIGWKERMLLSLVALVPIFCVDPSWWGISFCPDYYHLNIVLISLAVFLFQVAWLHHPHNQTSFSLKACMRAGLFVGILASNKISILAIGFPLIAAVIFSGPALSLKCIFRRSYLASLFALIIFSFLFLSAGLFSLKWAIKILPFWYDFMRNPNNDPNFTVQIFHYFLVCGFLILWWVIGAFFLSLSCKDDKDCSNLIQKRMLILSVVVASILGVISVWKRPAGSTLHETSCIFLGLGAIALTIVQLRYWQKKVIYFSLLATIVFSIMTYPFKSYLLHWAQISSEIAEEKWNLAKTICKKDEPIYCLIPDNNYRWDDPFTLFLKGTSDCPTWTISENGQGVLRQFFPGLIYYTEQSSDSAATKRLTQESLAELLNTKSCIIFWVNPFGVTSIEERYPYLKEAIQKPGAKFTSDHLPLSNVTINILETGSCEKSKKY